MKTSNGLAALTLMSLAFAGIHCVATTSSDVGESDLEHDEPVMSGTPCQSNADCGLHKYCETGPSCGSAGTCQPRPAQCAIQVNPYEVCGCDATTYSDVCTAHASGASIAHRGPCVPAGATPCSHNADCAADEFCDRDGCVDVGFCAPMPTYCVGGDWSTFGCDCTWYASVCDAHLHRKSVTVHPHACK